MLQKDKVPEQMRVVLVIAPAILATVLYSPVGRDNYYFTSCSTQLYFWLRSFGMVLTNNLQVSRIGILQKHRFIISYNIRIRTYVCLNFRKKTFPLLF